MRLLLDTHALLWALSAPGRLPKSTAAAIRDPANLVLVAQAIEEGLMLVTRDAALGAYGVPTLWA